MKSRMFRILMAVVLTAIIGFFTSSCSQQAKAPQKVTLRSESSDLTQEDLDQVIADKGFHCPAEKIKGSFNHSYEQAELRGIGVIIDHATDLMWLKVENEERLSWKESETFTTRMNEHNLAGFSDWRIPTVEELLSLMEPNMKDGRYIDPVFQKAILNTWSIDTIEEAFAGAWFVDYSEGKAVDGNRAAGLGHVHLVRTME